MDLSQNISNSVNYAKGLAKDIGRYVILLILNIIPIVNFIAAGYGARVIQTTPDSTELPKLERYGDMFIDGLKILVVGIVYMLIPGILFSLGTFSFIVGLIGLESRPRGGLGGFFALAGTGLILFLAAIVVAFVSLIVLAIGVAHMLRTNNFGKAFAFGEIRQIISRIGWGRYIVSLLALFLIGIVLLLIVFVIPFPFGSIIWFLLGPFLIVFYSRSVGLMYTEGAGPSTGAPMPSPAAPAYSPAAPVPPTRAGPVAAANFCIHCGARLQPFHKFCPSCGQSVTSS